MNQEREEDARKSCCCRKRICICISACILLVLGITGVTITCLYLEQKVLKYNHHYGVIFDAGSSHTDVTVYQWPSQYKDHGTAHTKEMIFSNCSEHGISSYTDEPKKAGDMIRSCINEKVLPTIPHKDIKKTPIYLRATAGMRLLDERNESTSRAILSSIRGALNNYNFRQTNERVKILTGKEEALLGWITANILNGPLNGSNPASNSSLMGALDMGGGSVEISFIPKKHDNILGEDLKMLTLYGNTYSLYAHSYLCYGFNEAQRRLMANLIEASNYSIEVVHPCLNNGTNLTKSASDIWQRPCSSKPSIDIFPLNNESSYTFYGSGSVQECDSALKKLFNKTLCKNSKNCTFDGVHQPPLNGKFLAFAGFGKTARFLKITEGDSLSKLKQNGDLYCKGHWKEIGDLYKNSRFADSICFQALYSYQFLTYGLNFDSNTTDVTFKVKIHGAEVGWSLGFMVNATNTIPTESARYRISSQEFVSLLVLSSVLTVIGLAMLVICLVKRRLAKNMKYRYTMVQ